MGRSKFSASEIDKIRTLLQKKCAANRLGQKEIRHKLRVGFEFNISDFGEQGKAFGPAELDQCILRGVIRILDDATIASMKARHAKMKAKDEQS
ncbi:MAG: hypothetical protein IJV06_08965 [Bacteroidaceae bacterium]|nr:hypothetical protein [Bacteroidaceae bacterium]